MDLEKLKELYDRAYKTEELIESRSKLIESAYDDHKEAFDRNDKDLMEFIAQYIQDLGKEKEMLEQSLERIKIKIEKLKAQQGGNNVNK